MGIDTGSTVKYNAVYPVAGINQSSKTFRDNFSIIKLAIERLQAAASTDNSLFSISTSQATDGQIQLIVGFKNNAFQLPVGAPTVPAVAGMIRFSSGAAQIYTGSAWVSLATQNGSSIAAALGYTPASISSPNFTGTPTAPTATTGTNTTQLATTAFVRAEVAALIGSTPGALDSIAELAEAIGNDPDFATTIATGLAGKADVGHTHSDYLKTITATSGSHVGNNLSIVGSNGITTSISNDTLTIALNSNTAHGNLAGGSLHALAIPNGAAGFMSGADKAKLDSFTGTGNAFSRMIISNSQGLNVRDATQPNDSFVFSSDPEIVLTTTGNEIHFGFAPSNTSHGLRGGGQLHAVAAPNGDAGFMSGADKAKLDQLTASTATTSAKGYMSPADKTKLDTLVLQNAGGYTRLNINGQTYQVPGETTLNFAGVNGLDLDYFPGTSTLYFVLNRVGSVSLDEVADQVENYNAANDRNGNPITPPIIANDGTAVDHVLSTNASANISFEWTWPGPESLFEDIDEDGIIDVPGEAEIDGFQIFVYQSGSSSSYTFGSNPSNEQVISVPAHKRSFILYGVTPDLYYTFGVRAYRKVDADIAEGGLITSTLVKSTFTGENPYRPSANVAFLGDVTGTIDGTAAATVRTNATNAWGRFSGAGNTLPAGNVEFNFATSSTRGGNALNTDFVGSQPASTVQGAVTNFNARNDRLGTAITNPVVPNDQTAIDHTLNADGSANISFEWTWGGDESTIDGFIVISRQSTSSSAYVIGSTPSEETVHYVTPDRRAIVYYGVPSNLYYTFFVQAYRIVDNDVSSTGFVRSSWVKSVATGENPYRPAATAAFTGDITGTINGVSAATVQQNAQNAWGRFSGAGNTLPAGAVEFNFAASGSRGGNALNTDAVGSQSASTVQGAVINFNSRNDRISTPVAVPVVLNDGTAVDHTINTDGSADISFEWTWTGNASDIDGFIVTVYQSGNNSSAYTYGTYVNEESVTYVTPEKRACILYGVPANKYYTFFVEAYRIVDADIAPSGYLRSGPVKSTATGENPYQPAANVAFTGNVSGTINGVSAATVQTAAQNAWAKFSGVGNTIPAGNVEFNFAASGSRGGNALNVDNIGSQSASTVQNAVINFNARNDRSATAIVNPVVPSDGTAVDHTINSNGSANISFEWTWGGSITDIDGFIVFVHTSSSNTQYTFGSSPNDETVFYVTPEKRSYILYGVAPDRYYTFFVQAYRIVDIDVNPNGIIKSSAVKSSRGEENPYQPAVAPVFSGDITGTINGTNVSAVLSDISNLQTQVSGLDSGSAAYSMVKNPLFSDYPLSTTPTFWNSEVYGTIAKATGHISANSVRVTSGNNVMGYFSQTVGSTSSPVIATNQWLVIEAAVRLISGSFLGAGALLRTFDASNAADNTLFINFSTDRDSSNEVIGSGMTGNVYTFTKLVQVSQANAKYFQLFGIGHFALFGNIGAANTIDFVRLSVRQASAAEIEARQASNSIDSLTSTVSTYSSAISTLEGRTAAHLTLATTSGSFAEAFVKLQTEATPGVSTSSIALGAQELHLYNTGTGGYRRALSIVNGNAEFTGGLSAGTYIRLGTGAQWNVALRQKDFKVTDGQVVSFGVDLGNLPSLTWQQDNLAPLSSGEAYWVYAENLTGTGFTARVKKKIPGGVTPISLTTDVASGTGPTRQMIKGANPDSTDGNYRFAIHGTITDFAQPVYASDPWGNYCVIVDAYLHNGMRAGDARANDELMLLDQQTFDGWFLSKVDRIKFATQECVTITTTSGITLTVSKSTPLTLNGGRVINVMEGVGEEVPVMDNGEFRWEEIVSVSDAGSHRVAFITAGNGAYAAGNEIDRLIFTHNYMYYKQ